VVFGAFHGAHQVAARHKEYFQAVPTSYRSVAQDLQVATDDTWKIIERYRTAEERNRAAAADIERAMSGDLVSSHDGRVRHPAAGGHRSGGDGADEERMTWLREDKDVWGRDTDAPLGILGR
jgi:hypothetical protein